MANRTAAEQRSSIADAPWLAAPETRAVVAALGAADVRFVGGAVRDTLLGQPVTDVDLATPLEPPEVMRRLEAAGLKAVPTGLKHGTITAVANHRPYEVTTLRHDVVTHGRHATVAFTDDWAADDARRDFTINAIYANADGALFDPTGGAADLAAGRVRFIGDAATRIGEDALRILRFFRFHARFGRGAPDRAGLNACAAAVDLLDILSVERIRDELLKILGVADPVPTLAVMTEIGVVGHVLPEAADTARLATLVAVETALEQPDPLRRLVALLPGGARVVERVARRFKLSNAAIARACAMAADRPCPDVRTDAADLRRMLYRHGRQAVTDRAILLARPAHAAALTALLATARDWTRPAFPVAGKHLKARGMADGPDLGACLKRLEKRWVASDFTLDRAALLALLDDNTHDDGEMP